MTATPGDRDRRPRPENEGSGKEPTHAPGENAVPGRRGVGKKPYPVNDPSFGDPGAQPGADPDVAPGKPAGDLPKM